MAKRRMFSNEIVGSDDFVDMPVSAQLLYFHLNMNADDDGFVGRAKQVSRMIGANEDDLKILIAKRFILAFEGTSVVVIKHWVIHNLIRSDLYKETTYADLKSRLGMKENGSYTELKDGVNKIKKIEAPLWLKKRRGEEVKTANGTQTVRKRNVGKVRLGKVSNTTSKNVADVVSFYNTTFNTNIRPTPGRSAKLKLRLKSYTLEEVQRAITNASQDSFFTGGGDRGWVGDLDYLIRSEENLERYLHRTATRKVIF